jgi:hypothetical protein
VSIFFRCFSPMYNRTPLLLAVFKKASVPKDVGRLLFTSPTGHVTETVFANSTLLTLLKEREYLTTQKYDFEIPDFLKGSKKAYAAIASAFAAAPNDWSPLEKLLPVTLLRDLQAYLSSESYDATCLPNSEDNLLQKIHRVRWTTSPPTPFPQMHPFRTIFHLIAAVLFTPAAAKEQWTAYLQECAQWYKDNQLLVDVLFMVLSEDTKRDGEEPLPFTAKLEIVRTHMWTFCRDSDGEWNVVDMDH